MIKTAIVDDHKVFRKGLKIVIEDSGIATVTEEFSTAEEYIEKLNSLDVELVFMDINLPGINGFEATKKTFSLKKEIKIIAMSANDDISSITKMLSAGASGYLEKDVDYDEIHNAIKSVALGNSYFSNNILIKLSNSIGQNINPGKNKEPIVNLTKREKNVLELICIGLNNFQIAEKLFIVERTVEKYKANLYIKTGTDNALNLVLFAFKHNLSDFK